MSYAPSDFPLPKFAAYIWLAGDALMLGLPPREGHERGHTVSIPLAKLALSREQTDKEREEGFVSLERAVGTLGFCILLDILREREREGRVPDLATRGEPTQYDIDEILRRVRKFDDKGRAKATSLADLGLE